MSRAHLLSLSLLLAIAAGCAAGKDSPPVVRDGGDGGGSLDGALPDGATDAGTPDGGRDAGPMIAADICESCETHDDCAMGSYCVSLSVGGRACVSGCNPDIPSCPRAFSCVLDVASGVDTTVCLPVGGACCVDQDADGYGQGVGCMGTDCDDADETRNPGASEICNGEDDDCDGMADDPPTDCLSGRCTITGDGTYEAVMGADCTDAMCAAGTTTDCGLFSCEDGGESGNRCATTCTVMGTDDDTFCAASAHCDGGACLGDEPDGGACDEDGDCVSAHCENGFCCSGGTCCNVVTDCPGGGGVARICENPMNCQGSRGMTECVTNQCRTMMGIPDDTACDSTVMARDCGLYDPIFCTGAADQPTPSCPTSCTTDAACIDAAHCDSGFCIPDRPPGSSCSRNQDCQAGLTCVDGVCCTTACSGRCQSCNLPGMAGTCSNVPATADPDGECPGFSCSGYYTGFGPGEDQCYRRQDVGDAAASCNGAGACTDPATMCGLQARGPLQIDCDNNCQAPMAGTCTGTVAGSCRNLDDPAMRLTCGVGACTRDVQRCLAGSLQTCSPGAPTVETCNGIDDNCNGTPDDGTPMALCPPPGGAATVSCMAGSCRIDSCAASTYDVNGLYSDGCECMDDSSTNACAAATSLGSMAVGSTVARMGNVMPGQADWYSVSFPSTGRGPSQGTPRIVVVPAADFRLNLAATCGGMPTGCGTGGPASSVSDWRFTDDQSMGATAYSSMHSSGWPSSLVFSVTRVAAATTCAATAYTITITR